jgi:hypothetical protein
VQKWLLLTLLLATPAAAQDAPLVEGFAEGFTFHIPDATRRIDPDGAMVYAKAGGGNTQIAAVRQGAVPCVFIATSLNLNEGVSGAPIVMLEETWDLRGVSFEANPKHEFAPPGGVYLTMKGPQIQCRISTGGSGGKLQRTSQCGDRFEATIEEKMMPAFTAASAKLKSLCQWKGDAAAASVYLPDPGVNRRRRAPRRRPDITSVSACRPDSCNSAMGLRRTPWRS